MTDHLEVAAVFPSASLTGGVERVVRDFLRYQSARRRTGFFGTSTDLDDVVHVPVLPARAPRALRPIAFRRAAARALAQSRPATVVSHGANCPPGDVLWVHSVHAAWLRDGGQVYLRGTVVPAQLRRLLLRHQVLLAMERQYFSHSEPRAILCTSQREIDDLAEIYGIDPRRAHVTPNSFDAGLFSPERRVRLRDEVRTEIGASADDRVVLMVANEWHRKGLGPLLEAVARLRDPGVRLDLVGRNSPSHYLAMADRLGIHDRVRWHGLSPDVARFYAAADVFALPTTYEPFGTVIIEAMACGVPVVTSRLAGAATAIEHTISGYLLDDPHNTEELAQTLSRALESGPGLAAAAVSAAAAYETGVVMRRVDSVVFG